MITTKITRFSLSKRGSLQRLSSLVSRLSADGRPVVLKEIPPKTEDDAVEFEISANGVILIDNKYNPDAIIEQLQMLIARDGNVNIIESDDDETLSIASICHDTVYCDRL